MGVDTLVLADDLIIADADYQAIQYLLAVAIREEVGLQARADLISKAEEYKRELEAAYFEVTEMEIPLSLLSLRYNRTFDISND